MQMLENKESVDGDKKWCVLRNVQTSHILMGFDIYHKLQKEM